MNAQTRSIVVALLLSLLVIPVRTQDLNVQKVDVLVADVLKTFDVPGSALAIVRDGKVLLAKGYGVRDLTKNDRVDEKTIFTIASNTKACTATALGMLVEEGKRDWDAPVIRYLPWFRLSDVARWHDRELRADAFVSFSLDPDGSIRDVRLEAVSPSTDFSFDVQDLLLHPIK